MASRALVCTPDEMILAAFRQAGFECTVAPAGDEAVERLRHDAWDLVALDGLPARETRAHLDGLTGERRRELLVVKVDDRFTTNDRFENWSESADLVVHPGDLARVGELVAEARHEREEFYRVFREVS